MNEDEEQDRAAEDGEALQRETDLVNQAGETMRRHANLINQGAVVMRRPEVFGQVDEAMRLQIQQVGQFVRDNNPLILQIQQVAQIIRDNNPLVLQLQQVGQFVRDNNPLILQIQQVAQIIRDNTALRCQVEPIVQAAERFARPGIWPVPPFEQRLVSVVDAASREVTPPGPVAHQRTASLTLTPVIAATATVTASLDPTRRPAPSAGRGTVANPPSGQVERRIGQILALVLVAIAAWRLLVVPEHDWAAVDHRLTVIGFGLTIAALIWNNQNKPK
jgi:uncharacterized protein YeeX (DUF496 family)